MKHFLIFLFSLITCITPTEAATADVARDSIQPYRHPLTIGHNIKVCLSEDHQNRLRGRLFAWTDTSLIITTRGSIFEKRKTVVIPVRQIDHIVVSKWKGPLKTILSVLGGGSAVIAGFGVLVAMTADSEESSDNLGKFFGLAMFLYFGSLAALFSNLGKTKKFRLEIDGDPATFAKWRDLCKIGKKSRPKRKKYKERK